LLDLGADTLRDARACQTLVPAIWEDRIAGGLLEPLEPAFEEGDGVPPERHLAELSALAQYAHRHCPGEIDVANVQPHQLGDTGPRVVGDGEEDVVALPAPGGAVAHREQGIHLVPGKKAQDRFVAPFCGD
jgi:hypothetical protein